MKRRPVRATIGIDIAEQEGVAALQTLLGREGYASDLHIGVAKAEDGAFEAHAWLSSGGRVVIGGGVERFTPLVNIGSPVP